MASHFLGDTEIAGDALSQIVSVSVRCICVQSVNGIVILCGHILVVFFLGFLKFCDNDT